MNTRLLATGGHLIVVALISSFALEQASAFSVQPRLGLRSGVGRALSEHGRCSHAAASAFQMQRQGSNEGIGDQVSLILNSLWQAPGRVSEAGFFGAVTELGETVTGTSVYRQYVQGAVVAFLAVLHFVSPETLQKIGTFHLAVCLPITLLAVSKKNHELLPALAKTLLVGGLATAQIVFATDENQLRWPSNSASADSGGTAPSKKASQMEKAPVVSKEAAASSSEEKQQGNLGGLIQMYGKVAMLSHVSIQVVFLGIIYTALNGIGVSTVLETLPDGIKSLIDPSAGTLAISFILVKLTMPVRLALDAAVVPTLANALKDTPLSGPLGLNKVEESDA